MADNQKSVSLDDIASLCKRRGFIFQSSLIYGGFSNTWDYGPYGVELKNNVKSAWWKANVHRRNDMLGMDSAILMHPDVWQASGHIENFFDLKSDCRECKKRFKTEDLDDVTRCPECGGELTEGRAFNLMFRTHQGPVEDDSSVVYLRPETAQGIFVNYINVMDSKHPKVPFGIAQIGKAFRNEITPGNFTFRTREFEQMEIEYFVRPEDGDSSYEEWVNNRFSWYRGLGIREENLRLSVHPDDKLAHYAKACTDIEYRFPFGWSELEGIANRTDYDLRQHAGKSGKDLSYFDASSRERFYPHVIEPSAGVDRSVLAFLTDAYCEEEVNGAKRVVLKLHRDLAPVKIAVLPLLKKRGDIVELAKKIKDDLLRDRVTVYDDSASIGKLYRRQDEVGTPFCVTVDVDSLSDSKVTVRDRDSMRQERVDVDQLKAYFSERFNCI